MLELRNVHAYYGLSHVLQGISLQVRAGEVVGLFGRNGVGKTTVMKMIAGWVPFSKGEVTFNGESLSGMSPDRICRRGIGFVPEDRRIFPTLSVDENIKLGYMQCPRRSRAASNQKLIEIYERFPRLAERRLQMGTTLSGGEQQMLAIARVLAGDPKFLLVDEPTEGLAPMVVDELFELMGGLTRDGIPILLVEQNVHRAIELASRFYVLERGMVVFEGRSDVDTDRSTLFERIAV